MGPFVAIHFVLPSENLLKRECSVIMEERLLPGTMQAEKEDGGF